MLKRDRFPELDVLRGIALILMIFLHILWCMNYLGFKPYANTFLNTLINGCYHTFPFVPLLFLILVGIGLSISYSRKTLKYGLSTHNYSRYLLFRGVYIITLGVVLTVFSMFILPSRVVIFGILQCIGLSIILTIPIIRLKPIYLFYISMFLILLGNILTHITAFNDNIFQYILGFHTNILSVDYFPLIYFSGFVVLGICIGKILYKDGIRQFNLPKSTKIKQIGILSWLGRHSLWVYLIHQPIIFGILILISHCNG